MASGVDDQEGEVDKRALFPMVRRDGEDSKSMAVGDAGESAVMDSDEDRGHLGCYERRQLVVLGEMGATTSARGHQHHDFVGDRGWDEDGENRRRWASQD